MKNKKDISFILPTNRKHEDFSKKVIDNINSLTFFEKSHEIVVVSPNEIFGENVVYIKEKGSNNGCVGAYNIGYNASSGDYIFLCSDDHYFDKNCVLITEVLKSRLFKSKEVKIACLPTNKHGPCDLPNYTNCKGIIARYPVFDRKTVEKHLGGFIYHPDFKHHYPDNWLGYWMTRQGEPTIEINKYDMVTFNNSCEKIHDDYDEKVFKRLIDDYEKNSGKYV
jgi:glycosyltransferase involved in cell wall biosynthesis